MVNLSTRFFTLVLLAMFLYMANVSLWSNHSDWLTHDLEHTVENLEMSAAAEHVSLHDRDTSGNSDAEKYAAVEHELLHAVSHLQLILTDFLQLVFAPIPESAQLCSYDVVLPYPAFDTPFRPPRV